MYYEMKEDIPIILEECRRGGFVGFVLLEDKLLSCDEFSKRFREIIEVNKTQGIYISWWKNRIVCKFTPSRGWIYKPRDIR